MYRPAWRISQTGVRSTVWPEAQRTRMSRSPGWELPLLVKEVVESTVAASVAEWRMVAEVQWRGEEDIDLVVKATVVERRVADTILLKIMVLV